MPTLLPTNSFFTRFSKKSLLILAVILIIGVILGVRHFSAPKKLSNSSAGNNAAQVTVATVASLSLATSSVPFVGRVTAQSQATILAQVPGEIISLPHALGDKVTTGEIIAEFSNSTQKAAVLQARGAYEAAQAGLASVQGTSVTRSAISVAQTKQNVQSARKAFSNALQSTYAALDDAVHTKADQLFSNPRNSTLRLLIVVPNSRLVILIRQERIQLVTTFSTILPSTAGTASSTLDARSKTMMTAANSVIQFLGNLATAVNETQPSPVAPAAKLAGYSASLNAARAQVSGALSGLIMAKSAYDNAQAAERAANNAATNGIPDAISLAKARLTQALGAYSAAKSVLEKTIIRSPINGTIVSLPVMLGDYVPMFSRVAIISNPRALYIKTFVTTNEARALSVGDRATINKSIRGVVTFIAPTLNPLTNKREVKIGITEVAHALTSGEAVSVVFNHSLSASHRRADSALSVPITAIKITPAGPSVFTLNNKNALVSHLVTIKNITGSTVSLLSGVTPTMRIVLDARGLSSGQTVSVSTNALLTK